MISFFHAILNSDVRRVQQMLRPRAGDTSVDVNRPDDEGNPPLKIACSIPNSRIVQQLLEVGANPRTPNQNTGVTPLIVAAQEGCEQTIRCLLGAAKKDTQSSFEGSKGAFSSEFLSFLLHADNDGDTALMTASLNGHVTVVTMLIASACGKDGERETAADEFVNMLNKNGQSALAMASQNGHEEVVGELLRSGANPWTADNDGDTPLMAACFYGHSECAEQLLKTMQGASDAKQAVGFAERMTTHPLLSTNRIGTTPLIAAAHHGHAGVVRMLLDICRSENEDTTAQFKTMLGWADAYKANTALHLACSGGHVETVKLLLSESSATCGGSFVRVLLAKMDNEGNTPFVLAAREGHVNVLQELFVHFKAHTCDHEQVSTNKMGGVLGALSQRNKDHSTALTLAAENGDVSVLNLLYNELSDCMPQAADDDAVVSSVEHLPEAIYTHRNVNDSSALEMACQSGSVGAVASVLFYTLSYFGGGKRRHFGKDVAPTVEDALHAFQLLLGKDSPKSCEERFNRLVCFANKDGQTPLLAAISSGSGEVVELLLAVGASPVVTVLKSESNPFLAACLSGSVPVMNVVLKHTAKALMAVDSVSVDASRALVANLRDERSGVSALILATQSGNVSAVEYLLKEGAAVHAVDAEGDTALIVAAAGGHTKVVRRLLAASNQYPRHLHPVSVSEGQDHDCDAFSDWCLLNEPLGLSAEEAMKRHMNKQGLWAGAIALANGHVDTAGLLVWSADDKGTNHVHSGRRRRPSCQTGRKRSRQADRLK